MKRAECFRLAILASLAVLPSCSQLRRADIRHDRAVEQPRQPVSPVSAAAAQTGAESEILRTAYEAPAQLQTPPPPAQPAPPGTKVQTPADFKGQETSDDQESEPADDRALLALTDLEQMALQSNPTLQQAAAVVDKARGIRHQVGLYPNPVVGYQGEEIGDDGTAGIQGVFLNQTIVTGDKLQWNRAIVDWDVQDLSWEYQTQRLRVINDVRLRFYEVLGAQRRIEIASDLVKVAQQGLDAAEALYDAKQGALPDVLQARVDLNEVRIILENARIEYDAAWKQLTAVLGRPELAPTQLAGRLEGDSQTREWEPLYQQLVETSPELQAASARVQRARMQIRRQEVQPIPNLLTGVGVAHDNASGDNIAGVQIGVPLPLFNRNEGTIAVAVGEYNRAVRDVERLRLDLRNRLAQALRDLQQAKQQVQRYQQDILPTARENLDLTEEGYEQGEFDFLRVLTARRTYYETNLRYVTALISFRKADVVLDGLLLTGGLNDVPDIGRNLGGLGQRGQTFSQQ